MASGIEGGPLQISADGGETMLALFETSEGHPMIAQQTGVAFSVDAETFMSFARTLPGEIDGPTGSPLALDDLIDFDMCWAFDLVDPWGNLYELNCYDYDRVRTELVEADGISPVRYWPRCALRPAHPPLTTGRRAQLRRRELVAQLGRTLFTPSAVANTPRATGGGR